MRRLAIILAGLFVSMPAVAADTSHLNNLYQGFRAAYEELNKLPTDGAGVAQAKADLLERFRGQFGAAITAAAFQELVKPLNDTVPALDSVGPMRDQVNVLNGKLKELDDLKGEFRKSRGQLVGKRNGLKNRRDHWQGEVDRLVKRIRDLGGQASLNLDQIYPGRPLWSQRRLRRSFLPADPIRLAHSRPYPHKHGSPSNPGSGSNLSSAARRAANSGFSGGAVYPGLKDSDIGEMRDIVKNSGARALENIPHPQDLRNRGGLRNLVPPPPQVPAPPPNLPSPDDTKNDIIDGLQRQLATARANLRAIDNHAGALSGEIGGVDAALGGLQTRENDIRSRIRALDAEIKSQITNGPRATRLFWYLSVQWPDATAKTVFENGSTRMLSIFEVFGKRGEVSPDWDFTKPDTSFTALIKAIKASEPYASQVGG